MPLPALLGVLGAATESEAALAGLNASLGEMTGQASGALGEAAQLNRNLGVLKGALGDVKQGVIQALNPIALFNKGMGLVTHGVEAVNAPLLQTTQSLKNFEGAVNAVGNSVAQFVDKANPALVSQWRYAVDDWTASIGRALQPALVIATRITRGFADVTFALAGPVQRLLKAFEPLGDLVPKITNAMAPAIRQLGIFIDRFAESLRPLIQTISQELLVQINTTALAFTAMVRTMEPLLVVMNATMRGWAEMIRVMGLARFGGTGSGGRDSVTGGSRGAAVQQASMGSVEGFQSKAFTAAFMSGVGVSGPAERTATTLDEILALLRAKLPDLSLARLAEILRSMLPGGERSGGMARAAGAADSRSVDDIARTGVEAGRTLEDRARSFTRGAARGGLFGLGGLFS